MKVEPNIFKNNLDTNPAVNSEFQPDKPQSNLKNPNTNLNSKMRAPPSPMGIPGSAPQTFEVRNNSIGPDVPIAHITIGDGNMIADRSQDFIPEMKEPTLLDQEVQKIAIKL